jgi:acetyl esterase
MSAETRDIPVDVREVRPALDPQVAEIIRELSEHGGDHGTRTPLQARLDAIAAAEVLRGRKCDAAIDNVAWQALVRQYPHGKVNVREYWPLSTPRDEITTTVVFLHGGGWVTGSASSYHEDTSLLAVRLGARVVSVDYRLAPEFPFPAAFEDCLAVVRQELEECGSTRIVVAGDSAGGNLALATALAVRDSNRRIDALLLLYPAIDPDGMGNETYQSNGEGYILETTDIDFYYDAYLGADPAEAGIFGAPIRAESFAGLPPTIVVSAGYDPLLLESRQLAQRLIADDVDTVYRANPTLPHGFLQMRTRVEEARVSIERILEQLRTMLNG